MGFLIIIILIGVAILIYDEVCKLYYWKKLSVPCITPLPIFGNLARSILQRKSIPEIHKEMYDKYSNHRYFGYFLFNCPNLMIRDVELVKKICIKDFHCFSAHREFLPKDADPFWDRLLIAKKDREWYDLRKIVAAAFTHSKMKQMFPFIIKSAMGVTSSLSEENKTISIDAYDLFFKFSNDFSLNTVFGIECNSFKDPSNDFYKAAKNAFILSKMKGLKFFGAALSKSFAKFLNVKFFEDDTKEFYIKLIRDTVEYRKNHNVVRPDLLHLLKEEQKKRLQNVPKDDPSDTYIPPLMTEDDVAVQLIGMLFTSTFTFTNYMSNVVYELALHQDIQSRLIAEIDETWRKCDGNLTYDHLTNMKYFDMVCQEGQRLRGPTVFMDRIVTKPYTIPPVLPHEKPLHLKPGQDITIPVYCFSRDEKYFENPEKFDPERFSDENKRKIIPETCLVFGYGPRSCVGYNLALVQTKILLFFILQRFRFVPTEKTPIPFPLDKTNISQFSSGGYWLGLQLREDIPRL